MSIPQVTVGRLMILVAVVAGILGLDRLIPIPTRVLGYYLMSGTVGWLGWRICRFDLRRGPWLILATYALDVLVACLASLTRLANPWLILAGALCLTQPWVMGCVLGWFFNATNPFQKSVASREIFFEAVFIINPAFLLTIFYATVQLYAFYVLFVMGLG